jgi:tetratricopeptide (TPR) repeat protein
LAEDENNVKALFRRGKARATLGQMDSARDDLQKAQKFAPEDPAIIRELKLLAEHEKEVYQKQKELYKGLFGPRPAEQLKPKKNSKNCLMIFFAWFVSLFSRLFKHAGHKSD